MFGSNMFVRVSLLALGILSGGLLATAAVFIGVFGSSSPTKQAVAMPPPPPPTMIVVAAKPVPTGTLIMPQYLRFAPVAPDHITAGDFVRPVARDAKGQLAADRGIVAEISGAVTRARFNEGDPIVRGSMVKPGDSGFLAAVLRPDMRAVTMSVNLVTSAAGLLFPGDHVDVVLTQTFPGHETDPGHRSLAETIATDLRVIAVDQRVQAGAESQKVERPVQTVTLEVSALQAEELELGAKMGELALAIRGVQEDVPPGQDHAADSRQKVPVALWAKDLSPASAAHSPIARSAPKGGEHDAHGADAPQLRVYRGDKVQDVSTR